jgi:hypothetical protein
VKPIHQFRTILLLLLPLVGLAALYASAQETGRARLALRDSTEAGLARSAADYLSVVTPAGAVGEFDAPRLISGAHALAGTSFWHGGLQVIVGSTALLPDSIGLLPLPDSLFAIMDSATGAVTVLGPQQRVQLVPLRAKSGKISGAWVGTWGAAPDTEDGSLLRIGYIGAAGSVVLLAVLGLMRAGRWWRWGVLTALVAMIVVIRGALGVEWEEQLRDATELRLRVLRHLVEVAATAPGVRQVTVPDVAASALVAPYALTPPAQSSLNWGQDSLGAVATILAATPRTLSGLKLSLHLPVRPEVLTGRIMPWLMILLVVALLELLLSGLSSRPAIFHTDPASPSSTTSAGTA